MHPSVIVATVLLLSISLLIFLSLKCYKWYKKEVIDVIKKEQDDAIQFDCESIKN